MGGGRTAVGWVEEGHRDVGRRGGDEQRMAVYMGGGTSDG